MDFNYFIVLVICLILILASAIKWSLPFKKYSVIILISGIVSVLISYVLTSLDFNGTIIKIVLVITLFSLYVGMLLFLFFRDPKRTPPDNPTDLVSPADGTVIYIREVNVGEILSSEKKGRVLLYDELKDSELIKTKLYQVGISLLFTDVHINRSPISGRITLMNHRTGKFLSLRDTNAVNVNERQTLLIENEKIIIGLIQIASRLVRRIESYVKETEQIKIGQKIGMIRFGSQVDLFLPVEKISQLNVSIGQYLFAGETVLANIKEQA